MTRRTLALPPLALLVLAACGNPSGSPEEEWVDVAASEQRIGVTCVGTQDCTGGGAVFTSAYRVGAGPTSTGELLQTFKAGATVAPAKLSLVARNLRRLPSGHDPMLRVAVYGPITDPVETLDFDALTDVLSGSTPLSTLNGTAQTEILLTARGALQQGGTYALRIRTDGFAVPATDTVLVGIGAITNSLYTLGSAYRGSTRSTTPWAQPAAARFLPAGEWDVAFALSGAVGSPCAAAPDCNAGLVCHLSACFAPNPVPVRISPATATLDVNAIQVFTASEGDAPYSYSLVTAGVGLLSLDTYTAPSSAGTATVRVTDALGRTSDATVTIVEPITSIPVDYLVVGGGGAGGGGGYSGGGGAGGFLAGAGLPLPVGTTYPVQVGAGGSCASGYTAGGNGQQSRFHTLIAAGGGGGGLNGDGLAGGSGGGATGATSLARSGGMPTPGQGYQGGGNWYASSPYTPGGGGGAGGPGGHGTTGVAGTGGPGASSSISGSPVTYAGGGGGSYYPTNYAGSGGSGGGGAGTTAGIGTPGTANTGGGGGAGGASSAGGSGGSGIVIIRYPDTYPAAISTTGAPAVSVTGGYRIYQWRTAGTWSIAL